MNLNIIPVSYIVLGLAALSTLGLFIGSIAVKTRERLKEILWGLLCTLGLWIIPFVVLIIFSDSVGLEIIVGFLAAIVSVVLMTITLIIAIVKIKKKAPAETSLQPLWLLSYCIPIVFLLSVLALDIYAAKTANIIIREESSGWFEPNYYYAINQKRTTLLGVSPEVATTNDTKYFSFDYFEMDYSSTQNPNLKWDTLIDEDVPAENIPVIIQDTYNIMLSSFVQKEIANESYPDVTITDLNNTGYYYVDIRKDDKTIKAIFYKDHFVSTTKMNAPRNIYIVD